MKIMIPITAILLFVMAGCGESKPTTDGPIIVDVTASYPKKEFILQDFMDVEYIPLETNDEFVTSAKVQAVGKNILIFTNAGGQDGDLFIFDRTGKGLRKINHSGQGSQKYARIGSVTLDEENGEIFINDYYFNQLIVYDLSGNYKRTLKYGNDVNFNSGKIYDFDADNLICYDETGNYQKIRKTAFYLLSKQDGSVTKEIRLPYEDKISPFISNGPFAASPRNTELIPYNGSWVFVEISTDTLYRYSPDHALRPFIVRAPSLRSMDPEVLLYPGVLTHRHYFIQAVRKEWDFDKNSGFPRTNLVYDQQEDTLYECVVYNDDFTDKTPVNLWYEHRALTIVNNDGIAFITLLQSSDLVEAYKAGKLKGKLKEIAANLDEESNPVIMLAK